MLSLTRREGEAISIGTEVEVVILGVSKGRVRLGIRAPREIAVHRAEVVARIEEENVRALASHATQQVAPDSSIAFPAGLYGLSQHRQFLLCDFGDSTTFRALVSSKDAAVQLLVVDVTQVWPDYPLADAQRAAGFDDEEVVVAAVATAPADGSAVTVNLLAPLVIAVESRRGVQVILDRSELGVAHTLVSEGPEQSATQYAPAPAE